MKNLDLKDIPSIIQPLVNKLKVYSGFIIFIVVLGAFMYLTVQIRNYTLQSPDEARVAEEVSSLSIPAIDEDSIEIIQTLQSRNVEVKALFENARNNPFEE